MSASDYAIRIALGWLVMWVVGCASHPLCDAPANDMNVVLRAGRASGGVVSQSATVVIDASGVVTYTSGNSYCARLTAEELETVRRDVNAPAFIEALASAPSDTYRARYHDAPHVEIIAEDVSAFVPVHVAIEQPLRPVLDRIDNLLRRKFGSAYRYSLLPPPEDYDYYRSMK